MPVTQRAPKARSQGQNRQIWGLATRLEAISNTFPEGVPKAVKEGAGGLKRAWVSHLSQTVSGQPSSSALSFKDAQEVLKRGEAELERLTREAVGGPLAPPRRTATITPPQQRYLDQLVEAVARLEGRWQAMAQDPARRLAWAQHYLGHPWPQTEAEADAALEAWKSILRRSLPSRKILRGWLKDLLNLRGQGVLTAWEERFVTDGLERSRADRGLKWGPVQWAKLHEIAKTRLPLEPEQEGAIG